MSDVQLHFLGSGDAFGSGGRFQTCFLLSGPTGSALIDCGASSLIAMKRTALNPSEIGAVLLTHLHGDHFGGLPFLILDGQFSRRERDLTIAGPPGVQARVEAAMEVLFPGSSAVKRRFATRFAELRDRTPAAIEGLTVTPFAVEHASGAPSFALRVQCNDKIIAYSGDTEWTDALLDAASGADLLIAEAYFFEKQVRYHLDYLTLRQHRDELDCKRVVLTHMSDDMLAHLGDAELEASYDGLVVPL